MLYDWRQVDRGSEASVVHQAYLQVRSAILSRGLRSGARLPSSRSLASRLGIARASVIAAYEQLLAEGYLSSKRGSGTYVSTDLPERVDTGSPDRQRHSLQADHVRQEDPVPVESAAGFLAHTDERPFNTGRTLLDERTVEVWRRLTRHAARTFGPDHLGYANPCGSPELRRAICDYLRAARAVRCDPGQIIVTAGTQHAIDIATRVLLRPGDQAWVEDPGYPFVRQALISCGIVVRPVPVDAQGLDVGAGIGLALAARAAFVTPSHQYPTGVVLSMARRLELLAWARTNDAWIVEDDYASEFRYSGRPLASLQGLDDSGRVIYIGTLNKALFPGLRLGYAVVPAPLLATFATARSLMDRQPPSLQQAVMTAFMRDGHLAAHIRRMRLQYRVQRDALAEELTRTAGDVLTVDVPDQGMHLVTYLGDGLSDVAVEQSARARGVIVKAMSKLYIDAPARSALMLGFSGYPREVIVPAAARLAKIVIAAKRARRTES
ncbi:PLP-dependent aminotransferase family protein [Bradyrhizobium prioriisuperbiae]|uniref:MocR-like pyridoxine biosynthesis transcription factor PdxR n=1 Tax=Bradyrhizobium prioriisuperbiae TaxID=2854389 RepID=UPI0028E54563|nr:PLP-dependent aminotransferase family protein [Bradyrhizobium prioritasuperba]